MALCIGASVHESLLLVLATLVVAQFTSNEWRLDMQLVPFVGLPVLVYVLIHYTPLLYGSTLTYEFWSAENREAVFERVAI